MGFSGKGVILIYWFCLVILAQAGKAEATGDTLTHLQQRCRFKEDTKDTGHLSSNSGETKLEKIDLSFN